MNQIRIAYLLVNTATGQTLNPKTSSLAYVKQIISQQTVSHNWIIRVFHDGELQEKTIPHPWSYPPDQLPPTKKTRKEKQVKHEEKNGIGGRTYPNPIEEGSFETTTQHPTSGRTLPTNATPPGSRLARNRSADVQ